MNHAMASLQVNIHRVDGSHTAFILDDLVEMKHMLAGFDAAQIFNRDRIVFTHGNSITSLPASKITRLDLVSEQLPQLVFPAGVVDAVELAETEYHALTQNPVMGEQWKLLTAPEESLVAFLNVGMADGQNLFLTMEVQAELLQSDLWDTSGFLFHGSGICFRMRAGGIALLNLAHLTRMTLFPKPPQQPSDAWQTQRIQAPAAIPAGRNGSLVPAAQSLSPSLSPLVRKEGNIHFQGK
jgi:hypothetical protein